MDYNETKTKLTEFLKDKKDPDEIRLITDSIKCLEEAIASDAAKSALIQKQAAELKEFFLNSSVTREPEKVAPEEKREPRSLADITKSVLEKR